MRQTTSGATTAKGRARASRKSNPFSLIGGVAVAGVVLACAGTVYANLSSGIYPSLGEFDDRFAAASQPAARPATRPMALAMLTPPTASEPATRAVTASSASSRDDFADRFGSQGQPAATGPGLSRDDFAARFAPRDNSVAPAPVPELAPQVASAPMSRQQVAALVPMPAARPAEARASEQAARAADKDKGPSLREIAQANRQASLAAAKTESSKTASIFEKLFGKSEPLGAVLAFASPDGGVTSDGSPIAPTASGRYDRLTAVYDISAKTVYMPDGTKLEAHSGLGARLDDPRFVHEKMRGATPPHLYDLSMRESLFHGVEAIRLNPVGGSEAIHGRAGLLAHTFMLGPNGDSNGCVSFRDYDAFLRAFKRQQIRRLAVVAKLDS